jgi:hypothetical protein
MTTGFNASINFKASGVLFNGAHQAASGDWVNDGGADLVAQEVTAVRLNKMVLKQDVFANRPTQANGRSGEWYFATDYLILYVYEGAGGAGAWKAMFKYDGDLSGDSFRSLGTLSTQAASGQHASDHEPSGGDTMAVDAAVGTGSLRTLGTGALQAAAGNHSH